MTVRTKPQRCLPDLFAAATDWTQEDGDGDWSAVFELHRLGSQQVLDWALVLLRSDDPRDRARAADVLGQLGSPDRTFPDICIGALVVLLERESDPMVLSSTAIALGHLDVLTPALVNLGGHADRDVRFAVAWALGGRSEPDAISTLIRLTEDSDAEIRDWATFGLGTIGRVNTSEVRAALLRRLTDEDDDTRHEAVCGLARCRDVRVAQALKDALVEAPDNFDLQEAAARFLGIEDECYEDTWETTFPTARLIDLVDSRVQTG